jgi:hypothetical protein
MTRALILLMTAALSAQAQSPTPAPFHWHDDYTEYHLLAPDTNQFHIVYYLNQRQAGLTYVLNQTRSGSAGSGISVTEPRTGLPLKHDYMTGKELADAGVRGRLNPDEHYIRAHLARPVPEGGEGRVRIEKVYKDEKSYFAADGTITFARSLGIGRNAIILPAGYKLVSSNVAGVIESLDGGRIRISFENINGYASDVSIRATKSAATAPMKWEEGTTTAFDSSKTLYQLGADGTLAITHQFVAWTAPERGGQSQLRGPAIIRGDAGPASSSKAVDMDTAKALKVSPGAPRRPPSVVFAPARGEKIASAQIRVSNTFKDAELTIGSGHLEWHRTLIGPRATIVLPVGYELGHVTVPATMGTLPDGRVYLQVVNNRAGSPLRIAVRGMKQ